MVVICYHHAGVIHNILRSNRAYNLEHEHLPVESLPFRHATEDKKRPLDILEIQPRCR